MGPSLADPVQAHLPWGTWPLDAFGLGFPAWGWIGSHGPGGQSQALALSSQSSDANPFAYPSTDKLLAENPPQAGPVGAHVSVCTLQACGTGAPTYVCDLPHPGCTSSQLAPSSPGVWHLDL